MWSTALTGTTTRFSREEKINESTNFRIHMVYYYIYPYRIGGQQDEVPILWI